MSRYKARTSYPAMLELKMTEGSLYPKILKHNDCRNFCSMDVVKGICRRTGEMVLIDSDICSSYTQLPKCKICNYYVQGDQDGIGTCNAEESRPWAYPEMIAVTCNLFFVKT
jgi:4-hydroxyphenylacetate decarboxylase small subunit